MYYSWWRTFFSSGGFSVSQLLLAPNTFRFVLFMEFFHILKPFYCDGLLVRGNLLPFLIIKIYWSGYCLILWPANGVVVYHFWREAIDGPTSDATIRVLH